MENEDYDMTVKTATAAEIQMNFPQYLGFVMNGGEVIVTENGEEVGRFIPRAGTTLTDSLTGILKTKADPADAREEGLREKYACMD